MAARRREGGPAPRRTSPRGNRVVQAGDADPLPNTVTVVSNPLGFPNVISASDSESVNLFQPSIRIDKTGDALSKIGDDVTYVITVTNTSSADSPNLVGTVSDPLLGISQAINLAPGTGPRLRLRLRRRPVPEQRRGRTDGDVYTSEWRQEWGLDRTTNLRRWAIR